MESGDNELDSQFANRDTLLTLFPNKITRNMGINNE